MSELLMSEISISLEACRHLLKEQQRSQQPWLRLSLRKAGCSGLEYIWSCVAAPQSDDLLIETAESELQLCVDSHDYHYALQGLSIGFESDMLSSALTYSNPNQRGSCGCGVSFTVE
ncbi:MAG: iron-sulfur cluster assembly accessory protein [Mariprofundales bacterium]|nr:iron-sulfur cluster assembly accessory protein [Mariprofundales bacterium]